MYHIDQSIDSPVWFSSRRSRMRRIAVAMSMLAAIWSASSPASGQVGTLSARDAAGRKNIKPIVAEKIILIGDSTVSVQSGWGGAFCAEHVISRLACIDLAREGRSTYSYRAEGSWKIVLAEIKAGGAYAATYVLIQFGHNDQPGKPGNSTDLATEYPQNLRKYVAETRAAGAIPVLVTPLSRRQFSKGLLEDSLEPWAEAVRAVAIATHTPLVDLHAISKQAIEKLGPVGSMKLARIPPPPQILSTAKETGDVPLTAHGAAPPTRRPARNNGEAQLAKGKVSRVFDVTHLGGQGADFFAGEVTEALAKAVPPLRTELVR